MKKLILILSGAVAFAGSMFAQTTYNYTGTVQTYTVPAGVTMITIDARGAQGGGSYGGAGGLGAQMTGTYAVTPGQVLSIVVGQQGLLQVGGNAQNSSGGGGGTFVYDATGPTLLVAAGGGGGKCNWTSSAPLHADAAGQVTTSGGASSDGNPGGTAGNGGPAGLFSAVACSGGGTGWLSAGGGPYGGIGYSTWTGGPGFCGGGGGGCGGVGGFGGGGGGGNHYGGGGGGGGYSGGGGGTDPTHGGGGGSYSIGTNQLNTAGYQAGDGLVIISLPCPGDVIAPTFTNCPANITALNSLGACDTVINYVVLTATDNCYVPSAGSQTYNYTGTIQTFTVPAFVTSINIDARGAQGGGSNGGAGGLGAQMTGTYAVTPGQVLSVVVGQQGLLQVGGNAQNSSGGGGGTFVFDATGPTLLVAAGGGGGKCNYTGSAPLHPDAAGQVTTSGGASSDGNPGGTAGNGGPAGLWSAVACAGGGTGWLSFGGGPYGGLGFNTWTGGPGFCGGGGGGCGGVGGFGGGGGGGNHYGGGGGGGGYSGGGGGTDPTHGGGGGSYSIGTAQVNTAGYQMGDGQVVISWLSGSPTPVTITQTSGIPSGGSFGVGITNNTFTATDVSGNVGNCSFTVTVADNEAPVADAVSLPLLTGCSVTVSTVPTATDNCAGTLNGTTADPLSYSTPGNYTVTWTYDDGSSNISTQTQSVTVIDCSGINEINGISMNIYPNPSNGIFTLSLSELPQGNTEIKLLDALGQVLYNNSIVSLSTFYDFSYLRTGVYYIQVRNETASFTKTIIITQKY